MRAYEIISDMAGLIGLDSTKQMWYNGIDSGIGYFSPCFLAINKPLL
jgi:hypothetical protein